MFRLRFVFSCLLLMLAASQSQARVTVERVNYRGWADSYRINAGKYSMVVVPDIGGRIMEYSMDGRNVMWENPDEFGRTYSITREWRNYGGYKTWIAPQETWGWPPDPMLDFGKANVEVLQNPKGLPVLKVIGAPSLDTGLLFTKEISLDESGEAVVKQAVHNIGGKRLSCSIWDVTQLGIPCYTAVPLKAKSRFKDGVSYILAESKNSTQFTLRDGLFITRYQGDLGKVGADSDGPWMIWFKDDLAYVKQFEPMEKGAEYPDGGCSAEVFTSDAKLGYVEMEVLGPIKELKPGAELEMTEKWRLFKLSQPIRDESWVVKAVKGMKGKGWIP